MVKVDFEKLAKYAKQKRDILIVKGNNDDIVISQIGRKSYGIMSKENLEYIAKESGVEAVLDFIEKELDKAEVK